MRSDGRKVYDVFPFLREMELLEIRLIELWDEVDVFVVVESPETFSGNKKPLYFLDNIERFKPYLSKIRHVAADNSAIRVRRPRTNYVRRAGLHGACGVDDSTITISHPEGVELPYAAPEDILLYGDVDEIPRAGVCSNYTEGIQTIRFRLFMHALNLGCVSTRTGKATCWRAPHLLPISTALEHKEDLDKLRKSQRTTRYVNAGGGWHFTSVGTPEEIQYKMKSICALLPARLCTVESLKEKRTKLEDFLGRGDRKCVVLPVNKNFPKALREHPERYKHLIVEVPDDQD